MDHAADMQWPRDSISTFDSDLSRSSIALSSVFSQQSRASSCTNYSTGSLGSAESGCNLDYHSFVDLSQQQGTYRQRSLQPPTRTLAEKQANNGYACSHCPNTFKKKADRKKHFQNRCTRLGDGYICPSCTHVGRNAHQVRLHRSRHGHPEPVQTIKLSQKRAFTCSDDGKIYYDAKAFFQHFESLDCALNHYSGTHHHQARVITLLQEGRYTERPHRSSVNLYAVLQKCCVANGISDHGWKALIRALPDEIALAYADQLEWGPCQDSASPLSRLGYISMTEMVADILKTAAEYYKAAETMQSSSTRSSLARDVLREKPLPPLSPSTFDLGPDLAGADLASVEKLCPRNLERNGGSQRTAVHESRPGVNSRSMIKQHHLPLRSLDRPEDCSPAVAEVRRMLLAPAMTSAGTQRTLVRRKRPPSLASDPRPDVVARSAMYAQERSFHVATNPPGATTKVTQPGSLGSSNSYNDFFDYIKYCDAGRLADEASSLDYLTALPSPQLSQNNPNSPSRTRAFLQQIFASAKDTYARESCPDAVQAIDVSSPDTTAESWKGIFADHIRVKRQGGEWSHYNRNGNFF
ncbi:hypothetical protein AC579_9519 [Pseudocercospora musae]|uniref:Uncharacterized protein n=1 Tax=Pseudocercospora musae TaxID=113226 RepID=A0A139IN77_9PEZI|nr:hypothetical protein AC579_9519 [Pseudocercospora musae]